MTLQQDLDGLKHMKGDVNRKASPPPTKHEMQTVTTVAVPCSTSTPSSQQHDAMLPSLQPLAHSLRRPPAKPSAFVDPLSPEISATLNPKYPKPQTLNSQAFGKGVQTKWSFSSPGTATSSRPATSAAVLGGVHLAPSTTARVIRPSTSVQLEGADLEVVLLRVSVPST